MTRSRKARSAAATAAAAARPMRNNSGPVRGKRFSYGITLLRGYSIIPCGAGFLELRYQRADDRLVNYRLDGVPVVARQRRNGRILERRQDLEHLLEVAVGDVELEADHVARDDGAASSSAKFSILPRFQESFQALLVGDEPRRRREDGVDDSKVIGAQARTGLGDFDDGVDEARLDLGSAPRKLDPRVYAALLEEPFRNRRPAPSR